MSDDQPKGRRTGPVPSRAEGPVPSVVEEPVHGVDVQVDEEFRTRVAIEPLHWAALETLAHQGMTAACELAVVVTDNDTLRELNRRYRGVDAPTDVLAFPDETRGPFVGAPGFPRYLGDVVISYPQAEAQAAEASHSVEAELQLLVVHGVLHLLGHDDVTEEQRARMWAAQAAVLSRLGLSISLPEG